MRRPKDVEGASNAGAFGQSGTVSKISSMATISRLRHHQRTTADLPLK
jgi:hypothetical protein